MAAPDHRPNSVVLSLPDFRLNAGEPLGVGLKRLSLLQIEQAVTGFFDGEEAFPDAVHTARKATKRLRALLRLARSEIGEKVYRYENKVLRDTARLLSDVRSAAVVVFAIDEIRRLYGSVLAAGALDEPRERLDFRRSRIEQRTMEDPDILPRVVANLEGAYARYASWPVNGDSRHVYGIGIRDSFEAVSEGLKSTYGRGRVEMVRAYTKPDPANFHLWRKRVKYLRHQLEMLTPLWPEVVVGMAITSERIGDLLGEDHDFGELIGLLAATPDLCPNPVEGSLIRALSEQRRSDLQTAARILGRRVYAETPIALTSRFDVYWQTATEVHTVGLGAISY
jgi:CHAD domain-containing protein